MKQKSSAKGTHAYDLGRQKDRFWEIYYQYSKVSKFKDIKINT